MEKSNIGNRFAASNIIHGANEDNYLLLPQSQEAEQAVIGAVLAQSDCLNKIIEILPNSRYFYKPSHQMIYDAILKIYDKNDPVDPLTLSEYLQNNNQIDEVGGRLYIGLLLSHAPLAVNAEKYAQIVYEKYLLREIIYAGNSIAKIGYEDADILQEKNYIELNS